MVSLGDSSHGHMTWARYLSYSGVVGEVAREDCFKFTEPGVSVFI